MSLSLIAQIIAMLGVISSFVYAGLQFRRNARAVRAATYIQITSTFINAWDTMSANPEMCDLVLRGGDGFDRLDRIEKARMRFFLMAYARRYENAYFQHKLGILRDSDWEGISGDMHAIFSLSGAVATWQLVKDRSSDEFRGVIDNVIAKVAARPATPPSPGVSASASP